MNSSLDEATSVGCMSGVPLTSATCYARAQLYRNMLQYRRTTPDADPVALHTSRCKLFTDKVSSIIKFASTCL